jgi:hypothetical protein
VVIRIVLIKGHRNRRIFLIEEHRNRRIVLIEGHRNRRNVLTCERPAQSWGQQPPTYSDLM